jgi:hypothetical protein
VRIRELAHCPRFASQPARKVAGTLRVPSAEPTDRHK